MLKVISRLGLVALLLGIFLHPHPLLAQVAPTNSAAISGSVSDSSGKPIANANVSLSGPKNASTQTDAHGLFVFIGVPFGTYSISAAATGLGTATRMGIVVQGDTNVAIQYEPANANGLKVIANVSSSTNAEFNVTPASITQVNPIADAFEGKTSWRTILEQIPGVAQAGLDNGDCSLASVADSPFAPVQISINGALPYETATLLDDMPLIGLGGGPGGSGGTTTASPPGYGTNLSLYPLNGFGAADVVRGPGAGAPSIVDSIGGSFLLHPPGSVSSNHYDFSASTDPYGGIVSNALVAVRWKKLSAVVTYGVNDSPGPLSGAGLTSTLAVYGISTVNGRAFSCTGSCATTYSYLPNYANGGAFCCYQSQGLFLCCLNQATGWSQHSGSIALTYALSPSITAEVFYAGQTSTTPNLENGAYQNDFVPPPGYTGSIAAGLHFLSCAGSEGTVNGLQASSLIEEKIIAALGRGILRIAALQNRGWASNSWTSVGSANVQLFGGPGSICSNTSPGCSTGTYTPMVFNGGTTYAIATSFQLNYLRSVESSNRDFLLSYTTPLGENFHAGASFVQSYYNEPNSLFINIGGSPICNTAVSSAVSQATDELRVFVGGNPSEKTSLDLSMYVASADYHVPNPNNAALFADERYNYAAPRLGFVWRPASAIAVRASAGGGFAEAPLNDLIGSNGAPQAGIPPTFYSVTLTNLNLRPETSFSFDLGTDIRMHQDNVFSFDVYRSNLYGQLYNSTTLTGTYTGSAGTLPLYTSQYGNLGESRYEGILLDIRHTTSHGIYWALSGGLTRGYVLRVPTGFYNTAGGTCNMSTGTNCTNLTVVPNINFNGTFEASIPYAQGLGVLGYSWNSQKYIDLAGTYYGNNNTYFRPAFVEFDGNISYPIRKDASFLVTFRNITGVYDSPIQIFTPSMISGAPTVSGLPYPLYGEMYGPRTVLLTLQVHM